MSAGSVAPGRLEVGAALRVEGRAAVQEQPHRLRVASRAPVPRRTEGTRRERGGSRDTCTEEEKKTPMLSESSKTCGDWTRRAQKSRLSTYS